MHVDPAIAALRDDPVPQQIAQERLERAHATWRANHRIASLEAELATYATGQDLAELPQLAELLLSAHSATDLVLDFIRRSCAVLREQPLCQMGLRHHLDDRTATLLLARRGTATLTLQAIDGAALTRLAKPQSVVFIPSESVERVLSGAARASLVTAKPAGPDRVALTSAIVDFFPGTVWHRDGSCEALQFGGFSGCMLVLKLQRRFPGNRPSREYRIADGQLLGQAAGNPRDSRIELAAALLGRMRRVDAAPLLAAVAEEDGGDGLRWQSLRECLALDSEQGFRSLCRIAADTADALSAPAQALRTQLVETWPQLEVIEPCRVF